MDIITRTIKDRIVKRLQPGKAILIYGARRVGKTVLMRSIVNEFNGSSIVLNGEDLNTQNMLANRTVTNYRNLFQKTDLLVIDEAQSIPDIGSKLKLMVDEVPGICILATGSSSLELQNKAGEPLVGRGTQVLLLPFSHQEIAGRENAVKIRQNLENRLIYGCYPEVVNLQDNELREDYLRDLVNSYLLKDILAIDGIRNAAKVKNLLQLISFQVSDEVSLDELGKQLHLHRDTVEKYLDLLSQVFVIYRLNAFSRNLRKELSKAGKWYFYDNGIRNAVIGNFNPLSIRQDTGALWENYAIGERIKQNNNNNLHNSYYFWRTYDQQEIDLIEDTGTQLHAFEFKWGKKNPPVPTAFNKAYPKATFDIVNPHNYTQWLQSETVEDE